MNIKITVKLNFELAGLWAINIIIYKIFSLILLVLPEALKDQYIFTTTIV